MESLIVDHTASTHQLASQYQARFDAQEAADAERFAQAREYLRTIEAENAAERTSLLQQIDTQKAEHAQELTSLSEAQDAALEGVEEVFLAECKEMNDINARAIDDYKRRIKSLKAAAKDASHEHDLQLNLQGSAHQAELAAQKDTHAAALLELRVGFEAQLVEREESSRHNAFILRRRLAITNVTHAILDFQHAAELEHRQSAHLLAIQEAEERTTGELAHLAVQEESARHDAFVTRRQLALTNVTHSILRSQHAAELEYRQSVNHLAIQEVEERTTRELAQLAEQEENARRDAFIFCRQLVITTVTHAILNSQHAAELKHCRSVNLLAIREVEERTAREVAQVHEARLAEMADRDLAHSQELSSLEARFNDQVAADLEEKKALRNELDESNAENETLMAALIRAEDTAEELDIVVEDMEKAHAHDLETFMLLTLTELENFSANGAIQFNQDPEQFYSVDVYTAHQTLMKGLSDMVEGCALSDVPCAVVSPHHIHHIFICSRFYFFTFLGRVQ